MLENIQSRVMSEQVGDANRNVVVTESCQLMPNELVTHVNNSAAAVVITLPNVKEAQGKIYSIRTIAIAGGTGVDVIADGSQIFAQTEGSTVINAAAAVAIDAVNDFLLLYSDGFAWYVLAFNIA